MNSDLIEIINLLSQFHAEDLEKGIDELVAKNELFDLSSIGSVGALKVIYELFSTVPKFQLLKDTPTLIRLAKTPPTTAQIVFECLGNPDIPNILRARKSELGRSVTALIRKENPTFNETHAENLFEQLSTVCEELQKNKTFSNINQSLINALNEIKLKREQIQGRTWKLVSWLNTESKKELDALKIQEQKMYQDHYEFFLKVLPDELITAILTGSSLNTSLEFIASASAEVFWKYKCIRFGC